MPKLALVKATSILHKTAVAKLLSLLLIGLIISVFFPNNAYSQSDYSQAEIIHVSSPEWPNWSNRDGSGFYFELIKAVYAAKNMQTSIEINNFISSKKLVSEGRSDIVIGILKRNNIDSEFFSPHYPIDKEDFVVISKKINSWINRDELNGKRIIIPKGYLENTFQPFDFERIEINESHQGFKMLIAGRGKHLILSQSEIDNLVETLEINIDDFHIKNLHTDYTYLGFTNNERGRLLAKIYDEQIPLLINNGTIEKLYLKTAIEPHTLLQLPNSW